MGIHLNCLWFNNEPNFFLKHCCIYSVAMNDAFMEFLTEAELQLLLRVQFVSFDHLGISFLSTHHAFVQSINQNLRLLPGGDTPHLLEHCSHWIHTLDHSSVL